MGVVTILVKEGVAFPMLVFPKGDADEMEKSKLMNLMYFFVVATLHIKQGRILSGKFVLL